MATKQVYGKYGTLAKMYLEEHEPARAWALGKNLPEYLHGIDRQADELIRCMKSCPSRMNSRGRGIISPMCADKVNCGRG